MNVTNENSVKKIKNKITSKKSIKILINNAAIVNKVVKIKTLNHNSLDKIKLNNVKAKLMLD